eukprot:TRINITY_DN66689_c7_g1_i1.p1 TRINITY_DN66689_c7_g1~~TRINITY_DN66689_c7_g1_i1.p1  ORF type:complete len:288 (+),score=-2.38 TRINITY_DN66689_c7_g1_i1:127-990(+)
MNSSHVDLSEYPEDINENQQIYAEIPVYRHISGSNQDTLGIISPDDVLPSDNFLVDIPIYHKNENQMINNPIIINNKLMNSDLLNFNNISSTLLPQNNERISSFSPTQFPFYDYTDIHPLENTHINITCTENNKEDIFTSCMMKYLNDYHDKITYTTTEECTLNLIQSSKKGFYKCTTGQLNDDYSYNDDYCCFAIQVYNDSNNKDNMIIEWQRRRGNRKTFDLFYQHFKSIINEYITNTINNKKSNNQTTSNNNKLTKQLSGSPDKNSDDVISPTAPSDMFDDILA